MELLCLLIGWLLGLLGPSITNRINQSYRKKELFDGVKTEIKECQFRIILVAYLLGLRFGKYDKEYLRWCLPYFQNYQGIEPTENTIETIKIFLESPDENIENALNLKRSAEKGLSLSLKRFYLPFLDSKIGEIASFNIELQNVIYEIRSRLQIINEEIDSTIRYFYMTFDSTMSAENHEIIRKGLIQKYINLQTQLITLVKKMDHCLNYKSKI